MKIILLVMAMTMAYAQEMTPLIGDWELKGDYTKKRALAMNGKEVTDKMLESDVASIKIEANKIFVTRYKITKEYKIKSVQFANMNDLYSIIADDWLSPSQGGTDTLFVFGFHQKSLIWYRLFEVDAVFIKQLD